MDLLNKIFCMGTKRVGEHHAAKTAAKLALLNLGFNQPDRLKIQKNEFGAPYVDKSVSISLCHSNLKGWAAVFPQKSNLCGNIGIDVETIEIRSQVFLKEWFTEHELSLMQAFSMNEYPDLACSSTAMWFVKEAVSKSLEFRSFGL